MRLEKVLAQLLDGDALFVCDVVQVGALELSLFLLLIDLAPVLVLLNHLLDELLATLLFTNGNGPLKVLLLG